jgi:prolipoprotein diacylglyceryl transferase
MMSGLGSVGRQTSDVIALYQSIPSPSSGVVEIVGVSLHMYGLMIALGVYAAVAITTSRYRARGGNADHVFTVALWSIPAGIIGARLYHVATDWRSFRGRWGDVVKIWEGGLGVWGGVALGTLVGVVVVRRIGADLSKFLAACAVGIPVAQAIGRVGNWWNQELFGRPTSLPWGLEIDERFRPAEYVSFTTFHPTFLYEATWCLLVATLVVVVQRRWNIFDGRLFASYVALYTFGRFWIERVRIDDASMIGPFRINELVSLLVFVGAVICLVLPTLRQRRAARAVAAAEQSDQSEPSDQADQSLSPSESE